MKRSLPIVLLALSISSLPLLATAAAPPKAKDIILTRLSNPVPTTTPTQSSTYGMSVSVLVVGQDGLLMPRATDTVFKTGDRFRLRILPTLDGTIVISNTDPQNQTRELVRVPVRAGLETLIPAEPDNLFQLVGQSGDDILHLQLYPNSLPQPAVGGLASKDIRLVTQSTGSASYVVGQANQPVYTRVVVRHQR